MSGALGHRAPREFRIMIPEGSKGAVKRHRRRVGKERRSKRLSGGRVPTLNRDSTVADAAVAIAVPAVEKAEAGWRAVADDPSPEHVHQFRVAIRQLRVVLHIFRRQDQAGKLRTMRDALKQIAAEVGRKRDIDVMIAEIVQPLLNDTDGDDIRDLVSALERQRAAAQDHVLRSLQTAEAKRLFGELADLPQQIADAVRAAGDDASVAKFAHKDLRKRWRDLAASADKLERLSAMELHEMRKLIKKLRYAFGHFAPLYDKKDGGKFVKALQHLQDAFGYLNDVASARKAGERFKAANADSALGYSAGYVVGRHVERARGVRRKIGKNWKRLAETDVARALAEK